MNEVDLLLEHDYPWLELIAAKSPEGAAWAAEYSQPELKRFNASIIGTFRMMARGQHDQAKAVLDQAREELAGFAGVYSSSVVRMHECWYCGILAYYYYFCLEDFPLAEATMLRGHAAITAAIEERPVLLPSAYRCCDTWLHRARIARSQHDWSAMKERIDNYGAIMRGDMPFCTLSDGRQFSAAELNLYFEGMEVDDDLSTYLEAFSKRDNQARYAQVQAQKVYILPWMPIQY